MSTTPEPVTALDHALAYAALGWRVMPITPGHKRPAIDAWTTAATTDPDTIRSWWTGLYRDHGVGILTGWIDDDHCLFALDVDGESHGYDPDATLEALEAEIGALPPTAEALTGGGGRHLLYLAPVEITNGAATHLRRFGPGLDVRGVGGQIVAPPSIHPDTGQPYAWSTLAEPWSMPIADAPPALVELLTPPPPTRHPPPPTRTPPSGDRPGDRFAAAVTWRQILEADGATYSHTDSAGIEYWTRPGKDPRQGVSASVGYGGTDLLHCFSTNWPGLRAEETYSKFGYYAAVHHHGDFHAASQELARRYGGTTTPSAADIDDYLGADTATPPPPPIPYRWVHTYATDPPPPPEPIIEGLLHRGEFTVIGAERGIGKTWLGFNIATLLSRGEGQLFGSLEVVRPCRVLYLQGELDETMSAQRWSTLTYPDPLPDDIAEYFGRAQVRVIRRRTNIKDGDSTYSDEYVDASIDLALLQLIDEVQPDVIVVDPWAVYFGGNENSNSEVEAALSRLRELSIERNITWILLHHFGKSSDQREPEDLWRGASRLADWAANRVTIMRYYPSETAAERAGLDRLEARRRAKVVFLRRGAPLAPLTARLDTSGWWVPWDPDGGDSALAQPRRSGLSDAEILDVLRRVGRFASDREAAQLLGVSRRSAQDALTRLTQAGYVVRTETGAGTATEPAP